MVVMPPFLLPASEQAVKAVEDFAVFACHLFDAASQIGVLNLAGSFAALGLKILLMAERVLRTIDGIG